MVERNFVSESSMEPMLPAWQGTVLEDLALELLGESKSLAASLAPATRAALARLVRSMNSYYSNLIEGHKTHPLDVERSLTEAGSSSAEARDLRMLAQAHIAVETKLEAELRSDPDRAITSPDFICDIHRRFYLRLPESFRSVRSPLGMQLPVIPGELRSMDVQVGLHHPPPPSSLPRLMDRFHSVYDLKDHRGMERLIVALASHHRLTWIHPFLDGNGRVTRLFTQCMLNRAGLDSCGLWAISRGLARRRDDYTAHLANADATRLNDYDGRGNLSAKGLMEFTKLMLEISLDQVKYMRGLFAVDEVVGRMGGYVDLMVARGKLRKEARPVLEAVYLRGELPRGEANRLTELEERVARNVTSQLVKEGLLVSENHRAPFKINFPASAAPFLFPNLYPSDTEAEIMEAS